eukprot:s2698_g10.t1
MEGLNNGDTAWMAMSCALVLFMTPGLAFFYGGLVRDSNIVNAMMMSIISMGLTTITWLVFGFTWSFDEWGAGKGFTYVGFRNLDAVWDDDDGDDGYDHAEDGDEDHDEDEAEDSFDG